MRIGVLCGSYSKSNCELKVENIKLKGILVLDNFVLLDLQLATFSRCRRGHHLGAPKQATIWLFSGNFDFFWAYINVLSS